MVQEAPYSQKEAEAAAGVGTYDARQFNSTDSLRKKKKNPAFDSGIVA